VTNWWHRCCRPARSWPIAHWQPLHPLAWRRRFLLPASLVALVSIALAVLRTPWALCGLGLVPCCGGARATGRGIPPGRSATAWWCSAAAGSASTGASPRRASCRRWNCAQSPFDRRLGMASLHFDTAGATGMDPALAIPYLPVATARRLYEELSAQLA
jgi:putative membrane protein